MGHRAAPIPLALAIGATLAAYACGRDEAVGTTGDPPAWVSLGGAGGDHSLGEGGLAVEAGGASAGAGACLPTTLPDELAGLVRGLSLKQVSVLQAVGVPIMERMIEIKPRKAELVAGRRGLVRAYVKPAANWRARAVRGRLTIRYGQAALVSTTVYERTLFVERASTDEDPLSTLNFEVPAEAVDVSTHYSIELLETETCTEEDGDVENARFPADDSLALGVVEGHTLRVRIVPVELHVSGQVFLPDVSPEQLELLRREVVKFFPVRDVELSVRDSALSSTAIDMVSVFDEVAALRDEENTDPGLSYYGLVRFGADIVSYCSPSCVLGASAIGEAPGGGTAVGVGYTGSKAAVTFAHELGHVYGRPHSPCGVAGDPQFPYAGGGIGAWGYDVVEQALVDPAQHRDFMGYCTPTWVSDHTYEHLRQFIEAVPARPSPAARLAAGRAGRAPAASLRSPRYRADLPARRDRVVLCGEP